MYTEIKDQGVLLPIHRKKRRRGKTFSVASKPPSSRSIEFSLRSAKCRSSSLFFPIAIYSIYVCVCVCVSRRHHHAYIYFYSICCQECIEKYFLRVPLFFFSSLVSLSLLRLCTYNATVDDGPQTILKAQFIRSSTFPLVAFFSSKVDINYKLEEETKEKNRRVFVGWRERERVLPPLCSWCGFTRKSSWNFRVKPTVPCAAV